MPEALLISKSIRYGSPHSLKPATSVPPFPQQGQVPWILLAPLLQANSQRNNSNFKIWKQYLVDSPKIQLQREVAPGVELDALPSPSAGEGKPSWCGKSIKDTHKTSMVLEMMNNRWCSSLVCRFLFCSKVWHPFLDSPLYRSKHPKTWDQPAV